ncbi:putative acyl-CoA-binding protein [Nilaparvata lugens]|uniref:putative acyl-CoA-binding protein n=1 Tax=Nilaparvata lugens TaxID=108931 RepID=UPI000B98C730|nr:putative acyl-CoA-binding protein [Nilaparvata lugens]
MTEVQTFDEAVTRVRDLTQKPNDDELLELYGLFKQATEGDNTTDRPGIMNLKGRYKWDAWTARKGLSNEEAKNEYVAKVKHLMTKYEHS